MNAAWGERLREALGDRGIKQLALGAEIGVDESAITRWKNGGTISVAHLAALCAALDVSVDWLLLGRGSMNMHKVRRRRQWARGRCQHVSNQ